MLAVGSMLNPTHPPAGVEGVEDLEAGQGEASAFAGESPSVIEDESPANQEPITIAAKPETNVVKPKSLTSRDSPFYFLVAVLLLFTMTVVTVVMVLSTLLSSLVPTLSLLCQRRIKFSNLRT